jgi:hypothetical protein
MNGSRFVRASEVNLWSKSRSRKLVEVDQFQRQGSPPSTLSSFSFDSLPTRYKHRSGTQSPCLRSEIARHPLGTVAKTDERKTVIEVIATTGTETESEAGVKEMRTGIRIAKGTSGVTM